MKSLRHFPEATLSINRVFHFTLILIPFTFPYFQLVFFNVLMVLLTLLWLVKKNFKERILSIKNNPVALLFISTYIIYVICLIYSEDKATGAWILEKRLAILLFPFILATENLDKRLVHKILWSFVASCLLATLICLGNIIYYDVVANGSLTSLTFDSFERERFSSFIPIHPPYFSLYLTFAIIILGYILMTHWVEWSWQKKNAVTSLIVYFLIINLLLSSRMPLIFLALVFIILSIKHIFKHLLLGAIVLVIVAGMLIFLLNQYTLLQDRFREITETEWSPPVGIYHNSTNMRVGIFICTTSLLKENWLLGLGTGNTQQNLNSCYEEKGYSDVLYKLEYNAHNEYFNTWLNTGIAGLLLFVLSLFLPLRKAYKRKHYLYLAFLCLIILFCATECLLERQKGIVFYAFFNSLFAFHYKPL